MTTNHPFSCGEWEYTFIEVVSSKIVLRSVFAECFRATVEHGTTRLRSTVSTKLNTPATVQFFALVRTNTPITGLKRGRGTVRIARTLNTPVNRFCVPLPPRSSP